MSMTIGSHFLFVDEDVLSDEQVYKRMTDEFDFGYQGYLGFLFMEEIQRAVGMSRAGNAC